MSSSDLGGAPCVLAVFGVPRSGTSWTGQMFNSSPVVAYRYQPLFSYEFKDRIHERSCRREIEAFHNDLQGASSDFVLQRRSVGGGYAPSFPKEAVRLLVWKEVRYLHLIGNLLRNSDLKVVLIVRHPGGVVNSWLRASKEFDPSWDPLAEWRSACLKNEEREESFFGYDRWKEAARMFLGLRGSHPGRVLLVRYEDLAADPVAGAIRLFSFGGIPFGSETRGFVDASVSYDDGNPYGVFRDRPDPEQWRDQLDRRIADELLRDLHDSGLGGELGYR